jgi:DDE domain
MATRGISVTYETIRQWGLKFGREFANRIRRRAPRRGDKWHLDEVVITIVGQKHWLWRAVDQEGSFSMFWSRADATRRQPNASRAASGSVRPCRKGGCRLRNPLPRSPTNSWPPPGQDVGSGPNVCEAR